MAKKQKLIKKHDKLDVYRAHYVEKKDLEPRFEDYLQKMEEAHALLTTGSSMSIAAKITQAKLGVSRAQAYNIVSDSIDLFGDITKVKKEGLRYIAYENFMRAATLAEEKNDHAAMIKALSAAAKLYGLFEQDLDEMDAEKFTFPAQFVFTDNVNILNQNTPIEGESEGDG